MDSLQLHEEQHLNQLVIQSDYLMMQKRLMHLIVDLMFARRRRIVRKSMEIEDEL